MSHLFLSIAAVSAMANDDPKTPIAPQSSTMRNADMLEAMSQKDTTIKAQDETIIELRNRIVGLQCQLVVARGVVLPSPSDIDTPRSASCTLLRMPSPIVDAGVRGPAKSEAEDSHGGDSNEFDKWIDVQLREDPNYASLEKLWDNCGAKLPREVAFGLLEVLHEKDEKIALRDEIISKKNEALDFLCQSNDDLQKSNNRLWFSKEKLIDEIEALEDDTDETLYAMSEELRSLRSIKDKLHHENIWLGMKVREFARKEHVMSDFKDSLVKRERLLVERESKLEEREEGVGAGVFACKPE